MKYGTRADEYGMIDRPAVLFGPGEHVLWEGRSYQVAPEMQWRGRLPGDRLYLVAEGMNGRTWPEMAGLTLRGYETNSHPGLFIETVWGSRFRDSWRGDVLVRSERMEGMPDRWFSGDEVIKRVQESKPGARVEEQLARRIAGEHLQDFYLGDASMLPVGATMRVLASVSQDVPVTEEHRAQRHPCAFLRGYLPVFWGFSNHAWPSQRPWLYQGGA